MADDDARPADKSALAKKPVKVTTTVTIDHTAEPYEAGKCTMALVLTIQPDDGHPDGPQVIVGVRSHDESPCLVVRRLNTLGLPAELLKMVQTYQATLPQLGVKKAATLAQAKAAKEAAEEKRKATEAARRSKLTKTAIAKTQSKTPAKKPEPAAKPVKPAQPELAPVKLF